MTNFYTSEAFIKSRFDAVSRRLGFGATTRVEWDIWRSELRGVLRDLLGLNRMVPTAPNPRVTEQVQCDGYMRERVELDTEPGVTMTMYVLVPDAVRAGKGTAPAIIAAHGHDSAGKLPIAGVADDAGVAERIATYRYNYGQVAAQHGYVVFCPDARGFGERRESQSQDDSTFYSGSCRQLAHMGLPLGLTVAGMWTWDLMRLLDYIGTRLECAGHKIGCIGLSGGGLQTLWLSALDERVSCAIDSGYFYGVKDSLLHLSENCDCNFVPHLWENADMGDLGALITPRPFMIETGDEDPLNGARGVDNVMEQVAIAESAYRLLDAPERLSVDVFHGPHRWNGEKTLAWLDRWLR
jgi:dienelactone hydrolase